MTTINPYAPPKSVVIEMQQEGEAWRDGKYLVFQRATKNLPPRCICCGVREDALSSKRRQLIWINPWWYLLLIPGFAVPGLLLVVLLVLYFMQKKIRVHIGICQQHKRELNKRRWGYWGGGFIVLFFLIGILVQVKTSMLVYQILFWGWVFLSIYKTRFPLRAARFEGDFVYAKGCGVDFLNTLPDYDRR